MQQHKCPTTANHLLASITSDLSTYLEGTCAICLQGLPSPESEAQASLRVTAWVASSGSTDGLFRMDVAVLSCSRLLSTTANTKEAEHLAKA